MEFFIHFMQQITEYSANTVTPASPNKALMRGTALAINLFLYSIFINVPILFPGTFIFILTKDGNILPTHSLVGISLTVMIFLIEAFVFRRIWIILTETEQDQPTQSQTQSDVEYKLSSSLMFLTLGMIPFLHIIFCPMAVIFATEGLAMTFRNKLHIKYRITANRFILFEAIIFVVYSSVILFTILIQGNAGAIR